MGVGRGVSGGTGVRVEMAKVGKGEGTISKAGGGATSGKLQASVARISTSAGSKMRIFIVSPFLGDPP